MNSLDANVNDGRCLTVFGKIFSGTTLQWVPKINWMAHTKLNNSESTSTECLGLFFAHTRVDYDLAEGTINSTCDTDMRTDRISTPLFSLHFFFAQTSIFVVVITHCQGKVRLQEN